MKSFFKTFCNRQIVVMVWIAFLLSPFLSYIFQIFSLRFIANRTHIITFVSFLVIAGFRAAYSYSHKMGYKEIFTQAPLIFLTGVSSLLINRYLVSLEAKEYSNFLYSNWGIQVSQLNFISRIAGWGVMVSLGVLLARSDLKSFSPIKFFKIQEMMKILSYFGLLLLSYFSIKTVENFKGIKGWAQSSYENKLGKQYRLTEYLVKYTPEDSKIIIPPQGDIWPTIGNQPIVRFFVFPRTLISGSIITTEDFTQRVGEAYFLRITQEEDIWPEIYFDQRKISFDSNNLVDYQTIELVYRDPTVEVYKIKF